MKNNFHDLFSNETKIEFYDYIYDRQDSCATFLNQRMGQALAWLDGSDLKEDSRILDAGCGAGRLAREVARRGYSVFGMDYSYGMIERANNICNHEDKHRVELLQGDVESIPFGDSSFDLIVCLGVITYLNSEDNALDELVRVLRPGGTLILSAINKFRLVKHLDLPLFFMQRIKRILRNGVGVRMEEGLAISHDASVTTYSIPRLLNSLQVRGLTILEYATIPHEVPTLAGHAIFSDRTNMKIAIFVDKLSHVPFVESLGGMCIFKARKRFLEG